MTKRLLLTACAAPALMIALATPASAQQAAASAEAQDGTVAPTGPAGEGQSNDDIVVTAQGRAQILADVPLAVSAVTADTLSNTGATDIRQLNQVAPSLLVSSTGTEANGSARIRGIGTVGDNPGLESSVAVFIDGVYRSRTGSGLNELGDIERIEVLRGPQGTLFGRNASAGLINIVSKAPTFEFSGAAEASYGNYDYWRLGGNVNVPLGETLAARLDGVYVKRDGFYEDKTNGEDVNDRNRYFLRGQLLFEPSSDLSVRLIADYSKKNEACCAAVYANEEVTEANVNLLNPTYNPIIRVLRDLGQPLAAFNDPYSRDIYLSPGRGYEGTTQDWGLSAQIDYDFGGAKLTSITAYRDYYNAQGSDTDYSYVDLLYRAEDDKAKRQFRTFSQELRLQGEAFGGKLDWLVGAYYAHEDLKLTDNLRFGSQYGRFAACRILVSGALAPFYSPGSTGCVNPALRPTLSGLFGPAGPLILGAFDRLDAVRNVGDTLSTYRQKSTNYAFFTHNIFEITDGLDLTLGARYTHETKKFSAEFGNDNTFCVAQQNAIGAFATNPALGAVVQGLINLTCQGNSTSELNGVDINDKRSEGEFTGTAILSYKVTPDVLVYGSYSRGYKAGGFNLDRSALKGPVASFTSVGGAQNLVGNLQFDQEINDAYEIGLKYSGDGFSLNVAAFKQYFRNFQLNTFNGSVFLVQNINACKDDLNGGDTDTSAATGACTGDTKPGVVSQGVELEASIVPARNFRVGAGLTYTNTKYRKNLIGNDSGVALDPALRLLPGDNLSNAPEIVATSSVSWTPELGSSGLTALFYLDGRLTSDYNTGSDLFPQKEQDGYFLMNGRVGLRGPDQRWSVEVWAQNLLNKNYTQVGFSSPFQADGPGAAGVFPASRYPGATQIFSSYLAEPRTFGVTVRGKF